MFDFGFINDLIDLNIEIIKSEILNPTSEILQNTLSVNYTQNIVIITLNRSLIMENFIV